MWSYDQTMQQLTLVCDNLPLETEALEILPKSILPDGLIVLGLHQNHRLKLQVFAIASCEMVLNKELVIPPYQDVEGLAMSRLACTP